MRDNLRRSRDQERRVAKAWGMRQQPASGSRPNAKSDMRIRGVARGETKETTHKSFSIKLEELLKLEREAGSEEPYFMIEFQAAQPFKRYVVAPEWVWQSLRDRAGLYRQM